VSCGRKMLQRVCVQCINVQWPRFLALSFDSHPFSALYVKCWAQEPPTDHFTLRYSFNIIISLNNICIISNLFHFIAISFPLQINKRKRYSLIKYLTYFYQNVRKHSSFNTSQTMYSYVNLIYSTHSRFDVYQKNTIFNILKEFNIILLK